MLREFVSSYIDTAQGHLSLTLFTGGVAKEICERECLSSRRETRIKGLGRA